MAQEWSRMLKNDDLLKLSHCVSKLEQFCAEQIKAKYGQRFDEEASPYEKALVIHALNHAIELETEKLKRMS